MGIEVLNGVRQSSGGGAWVLAWDSGDLTSGHDIDLLTGDPVGGDGDGDGDGDYDIGGVTISAYNPANAAVMEVHTDGIAVEPGATTNWDTTTDSGPGVQIDLADAGVMPGDDWCIEMRHATVNHTTSGFKYRCLGVRLEGASGGVDGALAAVGIQSSLKYVGVKAIEDGAAAGTQFLQSDSLYDAADDYIRMYCVGGHLSWYASADGSTWLRIGEYASGVGVREAGGTMTPTISMHGNVWSTWEMRVERLRVWRRAQP